MRWIEYVTLAAVVLTAMATVATAAFTWRMASYRLRLKARVERGKDGSLALFVELVNAGGVPVRIEEVFLHVRGRNAPTITDRLCDERGYPVLPYRLDPRSKLTIGPVHAAAIQAVAKFKSVTIVAKTEDGRQVKVRCGSLRKLYDEIHAAARELPQP